MIVVRVVQTGDLDALVALAGETGPGLTTFKPDRAALEARIARSRRTLDNHAAPHEQGYLFVMEDSATGDIAGVCGIETAVGLDQPFYNYRVSTVVHASQDLGIWTLMRALNISHDLTGYAELCSLFLSPRYRSSGVGGLLSRSRGTARPFRCGRYIAVLARGRLALLPDRFQCGRLPELAWPQVVSRRVDAALSRVCRSAA
jgi:arginine N-succinyltransferase